MTTKFHELSPFYRGLLMITIGSILLLHTLGILERGFGIIIILASLYLILQGMIISGLYDKFQKLIRHD